MKYEAIEKAQVWRTGAVILVLALGLVSGCRNQPVARTDQQITADIQAKIGGEGALAKQNIQVNVANGVATLSGLVSDDASRALAGNDAGTIAGVKTVVNNLAVQVAQAAVPVSPQEVVPPPPPAKHPARIREPRETHNDVQPNRQQSEQVPPVAPPSQQADQAAPTPVAAMPPPPPPKPVVKEITIPAGTVVPVRITETLDSKTAQANDAFHGSLAGDISVQGIVAIPHGSPVMGRVVEAQEAAHFKGSAMLSIELTDVTARGRRITLATDTFSKAGEGRGKNTAVKAGGGAALGAIIGAIAGGGKGAAIGGLAGGAAGTGVNAATRGQQVVIPTETLVNFQLTSPITVTVTIPPGQGSEQGESPDPQLQQR